MTAEAAIAACLQQQEHPWQQDQRPENKPFHHGLKSLPKTLPKQRASTSSFPALSQQAFNRKYSIIYSISSYSSWQAHRLANCRLTGCEIVAGSGLRLILIICVNLDYVFHLFIVLTTENIATCKTKPVLIYSRPNKTDG